MKTFGTSGELRKAIDEAVDHFMNIGSSEEPNLHDATHQVMDQLFSEHGLHVDIAWETQLDIHRQVESAYRIKMFKLTLDQHYINEIAEGKPLPRKRTRARAK